MKKIMAILSAATILASCASQETKFTKDNIDEVISKLSLEEKAMIVIGSGMKGGNHDMAVVGLTDDIIPGAAGTTHPIGSFSIPSMVLADGPAGLRISPIRENQTDSFYCTAFPVAIALSSTFNSELVQSVGKAMGNEVLEYGCDVILGPGVNIHRNILCGRNYEYFSEDPFLTGKTAASIISGIQSQNVGTSIKHFCANNQETKRVLTDSRVSQRALREIYLKGFEIAIKESKPWTVMTSYNMLNGTYTSENKALLEEVLRNEWGFEGLVMTDWYAREDAAKQISAGNDLIMPGTDEQYKRIIDAVTNGELKMEDLDKCVKRNLQLNVKTPRFNNYKFSNKPNLEANAQIALQAAREGVVLLKNNDNCLPIKDLKNAAVFGVTSYEFISGGSGSGDVNEAYTVNLCDGLTNAGFKIDENLKKFYISTMKANKDSIMAKDAKKYDHMVNKYRDLDFVVSENEVKKYVDANDFAIITLGRLSGEFKDRRISDYYLSNEEKSMIQTVSKVFKAAGKKVLVVLNISGVIEMASWQDNVDAIICPWLGGQEGGNAVADVINGSVNPSGRLPMTIPMDYWDQASAKNFPSDVVPNPTTLFGVIDSSQTNTENVDYTYYTEDIFVGYRYFDSFEKQVCYPFGFGLSYSNFEYQNAKVIVDGDDVVIEIDVKNVSEVPGKEVVQIYAQKPSAAYATPNKELVGYAKTKELNKNESEHVSIVIPNYQLANFDLQKSAWVTLGGEYTFYISKNVNNSVLNLKQNIVSKSYPVGNVLNPQENFETLKK